MKGKAGGLSVFLAALGNKQLIIINSFGSLCNPINHAEIPWKLRWLVTGYLVPQEGVWPYIVSTGTGEDRSP